MVLDPNLIFYSCIAKDKTVLAEFNAKDHHDLGSIGLKCLAKTPVFHSVFSHTIRGKTYMFLIQEPFTYFAICDENLEKFDLLGFLKSVEEAFCDVAKDDLSIRKFESLSSHCFQGEFNPVFHQLLAVSGEMEGPNGKRMGVKYVHERSNSIGDVPLLHGGMTLKKKKKKMRFFDDLLGIGKGGDRGERKVDGCDGFDDDDDDDSSLDLNRRMHNHNHNHNHSHNRGVSSNQNDILASVDSVMFQRHARKSWQKHVWIVLSLDLIICLILFFVWLWVCSGFKCIDA